MGFFEKTTENCDAILLPECYNKPNLSAGAERGDTERNHSIKIACIGGGSLFACTMGYALRFWNRMETDLAERLDREGE